MVPTSPYRAERQWIAFFGTQLRRPPGGTLERMKASQERVAPEDAIVLTESPPDTKLEISEASICSGPSIDVQARVVRFAFANPSRHLPPLTTPLLEVFRAAPPGLRGHFRSCAAFALPDTANPNVNVGTAMRRALYSVAAASSLGMKPRRIHRELRSFRMPPKSAAASQEQPPELSEGGGQPIAAS
jgi:hypothetical protein